jgi:hypothetical protein
MIPLRSCPQPRETSRRVNWRLQDLLGERGRLDSGRLFLPEIFAQT